jgi:hypothetical protein
MTNGDTGVTELCFHNFYGSTSLTTGPSTVLEDKLGEP